jgi:hypothetical protein
MINAQYMELTIVCTAKFQAAFGGNAPEIHDLTVVHCGI